MSVMIGEKIKQMPRVFFFIILRKPMQKIRIRRQTKKTSIFLNRSQTAYQSRKRTFPKDAEQFKGDRNGLKDTT